MESLLENRDIRKTGVCMHMFRVVYQVSDCKKKYRIV